MTVAEVQTLECHWCTELPGEGGTALCLDSVLALEEELGCCWWHLQQLERMLAEQHFKAGYGGSTGPGGEGARAR